jgi:uncharacterized protein YidB (DUF937 family)
MATMLDTILEKFTGMNQPPRTPPGQPSQVQQNNLLESVAGLLCHPQIGGIAGLAALFQNQGLGHIISGWIGNGPNPPVSPDQLQKVLGSERIGEIANKLGMDQNQAASRLAAVLPHAVDHLTPDGSLPPEGTQSCQSILTALKAKFLNA